MSKKSPKKSKNQKHQQAVQARKQTVHRQDDLDVRHTSDAFMWWGITGGEPAELDKWFRRGVRSQQDYTDLHDAFLDTGEEDFAKWCETLYVGLFDANEQGISLELIAQKMGIMADSWRFLLFDEDELNEMFSELLRLGMVCLFKASSGKIVVSFPKVTSIRLAVYYDDLLVKKMRSFVNRVPSLFV